MKLIDLSQPLFDGMPVYPGDPEVKVEEIHTLDKEGWNLRQLTLTTHIGTHVNVPYHMVKGGLRLDQLKLHAFCGHTKVYQPGKTWNNDIGLIFRDQNIDQAVTAALIKHPPKFVGLAAEFEFDVELERILLENHIISYENLANCDQLPESKFMFYGFPLNIQKADGSPVRAVAVI